ncbi:unnamed protein product [Mesocestoides corti]|nr:unnamed protein product [Mesocestoides corti]
MSLIRSSKGEPVQHQDNAEAGALRYSGATYNLAQSADPARASISGLQSSNVAPPRQSASPATMRQSAPSNIPPPLVLPAHTDDISPGSKGGTPNTANTVRPSSYIDQLHSAKHASSAVEAWVDDTMAVDPENPAVHLSESGESITVTSITESGVRDSAETYALPDRPAPAPPPPQPVKQPVPLAETAKWPTAVRPSGLPRPSGLRAPIPRLVMPPRSLMSALSSENVMTTSQLTLTANTNKTTPITRRALAPSAIPAGRAGTASGVIGAERPRGTAMRPRTGILYHVWNVIQNVFLSQKFLVPQGIFPSSK